MAIQIPELKRIDVPDAPSVGRDRINLPDPVRGMQQQSQDLVNLSEKVVKYKNFVEDAQSDTIATQKANQLDDWARRQMYGDPEAGTTGIKYQTGDPTELYKKYDDDMINKVKELSNSDGMSSRTAQMVQARLAHKVGSLDVMKLSEYGRQTQQFENDTLTAGIDAEKQNLVDASSIIKSDDPTSFQAFDQAVGNIRNLVMKHGLKTGGVHPDENGNSIYLDANGEPQKVSMAPQQTILLKKSLSEGLYNAMDNLVKSGDLDGAEALKERYGDMMDPIHKAKFNGNFEKADLSQKAFALAGEARGQSPAKIKEILDTADSEEIRHKAMQYVNDDQFHNEQIEKRASRSNYNALAGMVLDRQKSDQPFTTLSELQNTQQYKRFTENMNPKEIMAIDHMVNAPKDNNAAALIKMQDLITGQGGVDISKMSSEEFALYKSGLNPATQKHYDAVYEKMRAPESGAKIMSNYRFADKELADQLVSGGQIRRNQYGKFAGRDEAKWIQARQEMENYLDTANGQPMKPEEIKQHVREYVTNQANLDALKPISQRKTQAPPPMNGGGAPGADTKKPPNDFNIGAMSDASVLQYTRAWQKENNTRERPSSTVLKAYILKDAKGN